MRKYSKPRVEVIILETSDLMVVTSNIPIGGEDNSGSTRPRNTSAFSLDWDEEDEGYDE